MYKFAPASPFESIVFGAVQPGNHQRKIYNWIEFMQQQQIQQVCCLLAHPQPHLLEIYRSRFGADSVCWAPIHDFQLCKADMLTQQILPFLKTAAQFDRKVVVHCGGGIGRTGQVLAAWLVSHHHYANLDAIAMTHKMGRNPYESAIFGILRGRNPFASIRELNLLLDECHH